MAADCNNKTINKPSGKKFVSGADNWKNLKKSYADTAKSKGANKSSRPSRSVQQKRPDYEMQHSEEMDKDKPYFDQDSAILKFKKTILDSLHKLETKIMNISFTLESTDKQIAAISSSSTSPDQAKKCIKSDIDSDQEAELIQDTHDLRQSDAQIQILLTQQHKMKSSFQFISLTMTKMFEILTGTSALSSLGEEDEVANVFELA
ncbi:hypothetical protein RclHR1_04670002 [Rhizophagus clarus]|uniref:Uncharacterized protein n=1 Tax=Rhizophagus clarus TaxID=94130 RepID=A0A2Z6RJW1_9GLOM|nr:hypothetical protein RclHR1_04670002 [Rhizophagus clarus]GES75990.1 hypothetical protein GLOIN_2v1783570 [Rhizophagus clarus]